MFLLLIIGHFEMGLKRRKVIMESRESEFAAVVCSPSALGMDFLSSPSGGGRGSHSSLDFKK